MKEKISYLIGLLIFISVSLTAQNTFVQGDKVVNLSLGFGNILYTGNHYKTSFPPVSGSLEFCIKDQLFDENSSLGVGGYVGIAASKWDEHGWGYNYTSFVIGPRAALHYQFIDKLDTYTGVMLGYNVVSAKSFGTADWGYFSPASSGLAWSWFLGGRYYFTDNLAGLLELGYGIAYLNIGIALKLN